jgi:Pin2-interacting protein X1
MLRSQGWEPGQYLGVQGAEHAQWHTEANSTHIRVVLKDDQLGLGAKRNNGDECTGLDAFQMLLGRLNGKSEDALESERKAREDHKLNVYVERKLGTIRFVSGGFLVGDQLVDSLSGKKEVSQSSSATESTVTSEEETEEAAPSKKRSKKRKADEDSSDEEEKKKAKKEKKDKKSKKRKAEAEVEALPKEKKSKKRKTAHDSDEDASSAEQSSKETDIKESKAERKERREREKREKKERKEKWKAEKAASKSAAESGDDTSAEKKRRKGESDSAATSGTSTPVLSGTSTPTIMGSSRYLARQRFIAQKRLAFADSTALNQVRCFPFPLALHFSKLTIPDLHDQVIAGAVDCVRVPALWFVMIPNGTEFGRNHQQCIYYHK